MIKGALVRSRLVYGSLSAIAKCGPARTRRRAFQHARTVGLPGKSCVFDSHSRTIRTSAVTRLNREAQSNEDDSTNPRQYVFKKALETFPGPPRLPSGGWSSHWPDCAILPELYIPSSSFLMLSKLETALNIVYAVRGEPYLWMFNPRFHLPGSDGDTTALVFTLAPWPDDSHPNAHNHIGTVFCAVIPASGPVQIYKFPDNTTVNSLVDPLSSEPPASFFTPLPPSAEGARALDRILARDASVVETLAADFLPYTPPVTTPEQEAFAQELRDGSSEASMYNPLPSSSPTIEEIVSGFRAFVTAVETAAAAQPDGGAAMLAEMFSVDNTPSPSEDGAPSAVESRPATLADLKSTLGAIEGGVASMRQEMAHANPEERAALEGELVRQLEQMQLPTWPLPDDEAGEADDLDIDMAQLESDLSRLKAPEVWEQQDYDDGGPPGKEENGGHTESSTEHAVLGELAQLRTKMAAQQHRPSPDAQDRTRDAKLERRHRKQATPDHIMEEYTGRTREVELWSKRKRRKIWYKEELRYNVTRFPLHFPVHVDFGATTQGGLGD
ncbi:hypothetical protein FISHEDRAFT_57780 [Fistulina hepatica ATCC 64428]|uniref:Uncharacterized protein n=1 Tax=Fistulina hepatica ATCC 64428 TaxID=1128425 RepID=A0A0D7AGU5_9AGAR|nr:hypothetical protein FISHEDRAFT_57780 [Fistulina hepatica ATCC 64428]